MRCSGGRHITAERCSGQFRGSRQFEITKADSINGNLVCTLAHRNRARGHAPVNVCRVRLAGDSGEAKASNKKTAGI